MLPIISICIATLWTIARYEVNAAPEVTHNEIRDAILSLVHILRDNGEKLERHEYRERQLGEQLKKALAGLDKRYKNRDQSVEVLGGLILKFDERMRSFETLLKQSDEREKIQLQKSQDAIEDVQQSIGKIIKEIQGPMKESTASYTVQGSDKQYIESLEKALTSKLDLLSGKLEELQKKVTDIKSSTPKTVEIDKDVIKSIKETERLLQKYTKKADDSSKVDPNWHLDVMNALKSQQETLKTILKAAIQTTEDINSIPSKTDLQEANNSTQEMLQELKDELLASNDQVINKLKMKVDESFTEVKKGQEELDKSITELQSAGETIYGLYMDATKNYEQLIKEIKALSKMEQVMIQTADNVLDTKRRIEYGIHQILLEVGDLIKIQSKSVNSTMNQRFDDIEQTILENQLGALTNLSSKIETEISQVWRQIGIMYQQLTASADTLDKLQQQTDTYVNGSSKTMDNVEGQVSKITNRMSEVDENLNYLLGKLTLVASEFNQIKSGVASALDSMRNDLMDVQNGIKDAGPGPKPVDNSVLNEPKSSS